MKKILFVFCILALAFGDLKADSWNPGFGSEEPCDQYWWPDIDWDGPAYKTVEIDGCWYFLAYHTRVTPYGRKEFQITEFVRLLSSNCDTSHTFDRIKREGYLALFNDIEHGEFQEEHLVPVAVQEYHCRRY